MDLHGGMGHGFVHGAPASVLYPCWDRESVRDQHELIALGCIGAGRDKGFDIFGDLPIRGDEFYTFWSRVG